MTSDHTTLLDALEHISSFDAKFAASRDKEAVLAELRQVFANMTAMMAPHLDEEEDVLVPIIAKHFTHAGFNELIQEIIKKFNPIHLLWELAPMAAWFDFWCVPSVGCGPEKKVSASFCESNS
jgi:iron-sulfur cluster repair protein YtfE (RIC family)